MFHQNVVFRAKSSNPPPSKMLVVQNTLEGFIFVRVVCVIRRTLVLTIRRALVPTVGQLSWSKSVKITSTHSPTELDFSSRSSVTDGVFVL